ncbi:serine hydrolase domain-containing protein [Streptomyces lycii]|uniref:Beta-lactamase family protein n=1 Tax=Streptomyces lycii TaxID=2654337 RepID=A0ABQ7FS83_9ACTN|nr:serine hydrolase domain-containing protein [Streptomyces lycii]KAF4410976.1 beta-lactamase family protein [Streptomyces lycii]
MASSLSFSRRRLLSAGAALSGTLLVTGARPAHAAGPPGSPPGPPYGTAGAGTAPAAGVPVPPPDPGALRAAIADLDHPPVTAVQLRISGSAGSWYGTSGVADLRSERPVRPHDKVRVGSITKVFVATVVLQLVAEGRLALSTPVQRCLPGLLPAAFPPITVEQLLNHTSGLPDEVGHPELSTPEAVFEHRFDRWTPERLVASVSRTPMKFEPGTAQDYRGINYVLAALVVERLTGHHFGRAVEGRLLRPLGLRGTDVPVHERRIRGPHVRGYLEMSDGRLRDITEIDPSKDFGEGEMISTTDDLTRFVTALFSDRLLPRRLLDRMCTLPEGIRMIDGTPARFGTGLQTATANGVTVWGKTGEQYGYANGMFSTRDQQRRIVFAFHPTHRDATQAQLTQRIADAATRPPGGTTGSAPSPVR